LISFRFHLMSLASVFLALALGVVFGANLVNQATVHTLEGRIGKVRADAKEARDSLHDWSEFGDQAEDALVAGRLDGVRVLTIVPEGFSGDVTDKVGKVLATAGAIDAGTLTLDKAWGGDEPRTKDIATALNFVGPASIEALTAQASMRLASEFAAGNGATLAALAQANLLRLDAGDPTTAPGLDARILVLDDGPPTGLLEPLTRALGAAMPNRVLVADGQDNDGVAESLVGVLRLNPGEARLSTVDHIGTVRGRVAAVLALRDFSRGTIGDYGSCCGADRAAPPIG
jgi:hypothetical protein